TEVEETGWLRGNLELAGEAFGSGIFEGPGGYVAGATFWVRYNLLRPSSHLIPYAQAGGGVALTDIDRRIVGQPFNFNLDLGLGTRYLFASHWSLNLEYRYQHISNANLGHHNLGINGHGPILGVSFFF